MDGDDRPPRRRQGAPRHRAPRPRRQAAGHPGPRAAGRARPRSPPTDFTLGIDEPAVVAERAAPGRRTSRRSRSRSAGPADLETLEAVRAVFAGPIRVDANTGWTPEDGAALHPGAGAARRRAHRAAVPGAPAATSCAGSRSGQPLPIVADESAVTIEDLDALVGVVAGVNVKLTKCGGVGPALADAASGRASSASGRSSAAWRRRSSGSRPPRPCSPLADWVDLDGNLLLARRPGHAAWSSGRQALAARRTRPGLGLTLGPRATP